MEPQIKIENNLTKKIFDEWGIATKKELNAAVQYVLETSGFIIDWKDLENLQVLFFWYWV